jgi:hypothetical protein
MEWLWQGKTLVIGDLPSGFDFSNAVGSSLFGAIEPLIF